MNRPDRGDRSTVAQGGRAAGRPVLPHPARNPLPLVAGILAERTRTPRLVEKGGRAAGRPVLPHPLPIDEAASRKTAVLPAGARRGLTLIELLIVIGVLVALVAVAAPNLRPAVESRRMREAARQVSTYFSSAHSRAIELGRPCGVMIERFAGEPRVGMVLHQVETPPPYAGESLGAVCQVRMTSYTALGQATVAVQFAPALGLNLVYPGDQIQFNGQGPYYTITGVDGNGQGLTAVLDLSTGLWVPWSNNPSLPMPYKIIRQPQKSAAAPLQIPAPVVIDFEASGTELPTVSFAPSGSGDTSPVYVVFAPNGAVDRYYVHGAARPGIMPAYFLLGRRDRVPAAQAEGGVANFQDFENFWIGIMPQGLIVTEQVGIAEGNASGRPQSIDESREFVRSGRSKGGG